MKIKYYTLLFIVLVISSLVSCTDEPNSVGNSLIPEGDKLSYETIDSYTSQFDQSFSSFQKDSLYFGSSSKILLGNFENITSEILTRFLILLPDSIKEPFDSNSITIKSAWIEMPPNYWIGDSSALTFTAQEINESWNSIEVNEDSINVVKATLGPNILDAFAVNDSVIKFNIDTEVVNNWANRSFDDAYPENNGLLLTPTSNNSLAGFQGLTSFPQDNYIRLFTEFEREGEIVDTVISEPNVDLHWVTGDRLPEPAHRVLLQSSLGVRGKLWFDLSQVPQNILLNSAELRMTIDELNTKQGSVPTDTLAVRFLSDLEAETVNEDFGKYPLVKQDEFYAGDIRQYVQRWIDGEENEGIEIQLSDESRSASIVSFFGSDSEVDSLKPRLTIYYTIK